jgi:hypothetical protein
MLGVEDLADVLKLASHVRVDQGHLQMNSYDMLRVEDPTNVLKLSSHVRVDQGHLQMD